MSHEVLFWARPLDDLFEEKLTGMRAEVNRVREDEVDTVVADEWARALAARYAVDVPVPRPKDRWMDPPDDIQFDVSHDGFMRALPPGGGPFYVRGTRHVIHVPFYGDPEIFFLKPRTWTAAIPHGVIRGSDLLVVIEYPDDTLAPDLGSAVDARVAQVTQWLGSAQADADIHNRGLERQALALIARRKQEIGQRRTQILHSAINRERPSKVILRSVLPVKLNALGGGYAVIALLMAMSRTCRRSSSPMPAYVAGLFCMSRPA